MAAKVQTYKDLQRWLQTLSNTQLNAPILATGGADDYGLTDYVYVVELIEVAQEHPQVSGGYEGPVLLVRELAGKPQGED
jgi:ABC-type nitrate/sulfonate/bicarbonate transport system ATPase subunit